MDYRLTLQNILPHPVYESGHSGDHLVCRCPFCGKEDHFYINWQRAFKKRGSKYIGSWDCKKCGEAGSLPRLLKQLGRLDILHDSHREVDLTKPLVNKINITSEHEEELELEVPNKRPPLGWRRVYDHAYLRSRGFTDFEFNKYKVGVTKMYSKLKDFVVILIEEDSECKGYVARSLKSKEDLDTLNSAIKEYNKSVSDPRMRKRKKLRYDNSPNTDFAKLLLGIDELTDRTKSTILVEGFMDKLNVDRLLQLDAQEHTKCVATFGKKISSVQIAKLQNKGIQNIVVLFDPDAVKDSKKYAFELEKYFNTLVGFLKDKDPGDLNEQELTDVLQSLEVPSKFNVSRVQKHGFANTSFPRRKTKN